MVIGFIMQLHGLAVLQVPVDAPGRLRTLPGPAASRLNHFHDPYELFALLSEERIQRSVGAGSPNAIDRPAIKTPFLQLCLHLLSFVCREGAVSRDFENPVVRQKRKHAEVAPTAGDVLQIRLIPYHVKLPRVVMLEQL